MGRVYVLLEQHTSMAGVWLNRRISAHSTLKGAQAQAAQYAEERGETIQAWTVEREYLYETRWQGETSAEHSYTVVMARVMD